MRTHTLLNPGEAPDVEGLENCPLFEYRGDLPKKPKRPHQEPEVAKLLNELREWCEQEYGRQAEIARVLGVDRRRLYDWFSGRISPNLATGLRIQAFLASQKKGRRRPPGPEESNKT